MRIKPRILNPHSIISGIIFFISVLLFLNSFSEFFRESDRILIYLFNFLIVGFLFFAWLSRIFDSLYILDEFVGYKSIFDEESKKIKISDIKSINLNTLRGVVKEILITPVESASDFNLTPKDKLKKSIVIGSDFNSKELSEFIKLILSKNNKIQTDDYVDVLLNGGNLKSSYMEYVLSSPRALIAEIISIIILALIAFR